MAEEQTAVRRGEYRIDDGAEGIADLGFAGADYIEKLFIPDSVRSIGNYAFMNCYSLREIRLPERVDSMGAGVFQNCWQLRELRLPEGLHSIGEEFFENCHALAALRLPSTLTHVSKAAFSRCRSLRTIGMDPELIELLPSSAKYSAVLTFMEEHANGVDAEEEKSAERIDAYAAERPRSLLDLAINRKSAAAVRYMTARALLPEDVLRACLERSAETGRVEITAVLLDGLKESRSGRGLGRDPFSTEV